MQKSKSLVSDWLGKLEPAINEARDAVALDITCQEARALNIVSGNETYIGRRIIANNVQRELPVFIQYLTGSYRHVSLTALSQELPTDLLINSETAFTRAFRTGTWLEAHMQMVSSMAIHGRGVLLRSASALHPLNSTFSYIPPEDFLFPIKIRNHQSAPILGIRYVITWSQFEEWRVTYKWDPETTEVLAANVSDSEKPSKEYTVYLMFQKRGGVVESFWFAYDQSKLLTAPAPYCTGRFKADGNPVPCTEYPMYPVYYSISETPKIAERHGRAFLDMHDQEAITMIWTSYVNSCIRASELYISKKEKAVVENAEIVQTEFIMQPGYILKEAVEFHSPPVPDASILNAVQALRVENSASAGQVDFAAANRKDSKKTATELDMARNQSAANSTIPLLMFSIGYKMFLQSMWDDLAANIASGFNTEFMGQSPQRGVLASTKILVAPAGDIDYIDRDQKMKLYMALLPMYEGTPVALYFRKKILELSFPQDFAQLYDMIQDNSKQLGAALYQVLAAMPMDGTPLPPELVTKVGEILRQAQQTFDPKGELADATNQDDPTAG